MIGRKKSVVAKAAGVDATTRFTLRSVADTCGQVSGSEIECEMKYGGHSHRPKLQKLTEVDSTTALSTAASALRADNKHALATTAVEIVGQRAGDALSFHIPAYHSA